MRQLALCHTCAHQHVIDFDPLMGAGGAYSDWIVKHAGHAIEFRSPRRSTRDKQSRVQSWEHYLHNADVKTAYASSAAYACAIESLATSATLVAGFESTAVSNTTNLYLDYLVAGQVTVGTTPTTNTVIEVWAYGSQNDTPLYPDVFDGTTGAETVTSAAIKQAALAQLAAMGVDSTTSNRAYFFKPTSLALLYGGTVPKNHGLFVTHNSGVNLNSTAGNHILSHTGVYATVT